MFNALGDPVRQQLLMTMMQGEPKTVRALTAGTNLSRPTVSFHLKVLKEAGIVTDYKEGRNNYYYPKPGKYLDVMRDLINEVDDVMKKEGRK